VGVGGVVETKRWTSKTTRKGKGETANQAKFENKDSRQAGDKAQKRSNTKKKGKAIT